MSEQKLGLGARVGHGALSVIKDEFEVYIGAYTQRNGTYTGEWRVLFDYFRLIKLLERERIQGKVRLEDIQKKVAIVHNDDSVIETLNLKVREVGYEGLPMKVDSTTTTQQVAEFVERADPVIVFLAENYTYQEPQSHRIRDINQVERLDALDVLRIMNPTLPIYMVSPTPLHTRRAKELGANGYIILQHPLQIKQFIPHGRYPTPQS